MHFQDQILIMEKGYGGKDKGFNKKWYFDLKKYCHKIDAKWVLGIKQDDNGNRNALKLVLLLDSFLIQFQVLIGFQDTFSPTLNICGFRMLVALVIEYDLELHHLDIQNASLHGDLD